MAYGKSKNYTLAKALVALNKPEMQDKDYRDILSGQAKNGDIEEAKKTLLLIKGEEIKKVGLQRICHQTILQTTG